MLKKATLNDQYAILQHLETQLPKASSLYCIMEDPTLYDTSEVFYNLPSEDTGSSINLVVYIKKKWYD